MNKPRKLFVNFRGLLLCHFSANCLNNRAGAFSQLIPFYFENAQLSSVCIPGFTYKFFKGII